MVNVIPGYSNVEMSANQLCIKAMDTETARENVFGEILHVMANVLLAGICVEINACREI